MQIKDKDKIIMSKQNNSGGLTKEKYIVVCANTKQAKLLYERLFAYFKTTRRPFRVADSKPTLWISNSFTSLHIIPQRKMLSWLAGYGRRGVSYTIVSHTHVDKWLDAKFKEQTPSR